MAEKKEGKSSKAILRSKRRSSLRRVKRLHHGHLSRDAYLGMLSTGFDHAAAEVAKEPLPERIVGQRKPNKPQVKKMVLRSPAKVRLEAICSELTRRNRDPQYMRGLTRGDLLSMVSESLEITRRTSDHVWKTIDSHNPNVAVRLAYATLDHLFFDVSDLEHGYSKAITEYMSFARGYIGQKLGFPVTVDQIKLTLDQVGGVTSLHFHDA